MTASRSDLRADVGRLRLLRLHADEVLDDRRHIEGRPGEEVLAGKQRAVERTRAEDRFAAREPDGALVRAVRRLD